VNSSFEELGNKLPFLVLDEVIVYPNIVIPIFLSDEFQTEILNYALSQNKLLFIGVNREMGESSSYYPSGSIVSVVRTVQMPDGRTKVLLQGLAKGIIISVVDEHIPHVFFEPIIDVQSSQDKTVIKSLMKGVRDKLETLISLGRFISPDMMMIIEDVSDPGRLSDIIASHMGFEIEEAQALLTSNDSYQRLLRIDKLLANEIEILHLQLDIQNKVKDEMSNSQREYFLREQMRIIRGELGESGIPEDDLESLRKRVEGINLPPYVKKEINNQFAKLSRIPQDAAEYTVVRNYTEWLIDIPWDKKSQDNIELKRVSEVLDEDHYGILNVKERIIEFLAVKKLTNSLKGPILCLVGAPGVGKTSLGKSIARAMGRKFERIALGGIKDDAEIRGHRRTYIGSMPGRIIQSLKRAKTMNPVIMLDEIDKLASDYRGDPTSSLLEVLDPEQNNSFMDNYINLEVDLSNVLFLANANSLEDIPAPLRDRMEILELSGYSEIEKVEIAIKYLLPKQLKLCGLQDVPVTLSREAILTTIRHYTLETGLRGLEQRIASLFRKIARKHVSGESFKRTLKIKDARELLGPYQYEMDMRDTQKAKVGVVTGLAWTKIGGDVIYIESKVMKGKGKIELTGHLGDVMKESILTALSYVRSKAHGMELDENIFYNGDFHVHVPAAAIPKDGPSAGVSMCISLVSALTGLPIRADIAMTGEITLHGRILPIGGVKEKILAALRYGIKTVILPAKNKKDIEKIEKEIMKLVRIVFVDSIEQIFRECLVGYNGVFKGHFLDKAQQVKNDYKSKRVV